MTTLAELRLANLREQKKSAQDPTEDAVASAPLAAAPAPEPEKTIAALVVPPPTSVRGEDLVLSQYLTDADQSAAPEPHLHTETEAEKSAALIARVQEALSHKTLHPNGAKATVDMSPALFHRAKRYCLDHGNVTLRQLFLDLMTAFLDEEGY